MLLAALDPSSPAIFFRRYFLHAMKSAPGCTGRSCRVQIAGRKAVSPARWRCHASRAPPLLLTLKGPSSHDDPPDCGAGERPPPLIVEAARFYAPIVACRKSATSEHSNRPIGAARDVRIKRVRESQNRVKFAAGGFGCFARLALYSSTAFNTGPITHSYCVPMLYSSRGSDSMLKILG